MATTTILRPELSGLTEVPITPTIATSELAAFRAGRPPEDRLVDLLAFAMAAESGQPATPETIEQLRQDATTSLSDHAFRYLHNTVEQIRHEAVAEQLGKAPRPPGFGTLLLANLLALAIAGLVAGWLALHPATLAGLAGFLAG
jgi:hypothetical protein